MTTRSSSLSAAPISGVGRRVFVAGASGAIGQRLVLLLCRAGFHVTGTTRTPAKVERLRALGAEPSLLDAFDADAVRAAVARARPEIVMHQLTDLPQVAAPEAMAAGRERTARLREQATPILLRAAQEAGAHRIIVQSICFVYAPGPRPHREEDLIASPSVAAMERATREARGIEGIVLRYGRLWGPGTWAETAQGLEAPLHVDAAAHAALLAVNRGSAGIYNVAEDDGVVLIEKARRELGFDPGFRLSEA